MPNPNIDEQVVKMTFDNQQFEKGVQTSLKTIEELKKALEFDKIADKLQGLEDVSSAITLRLNDIGRSAESVANTFRPLGKIINKTLDELTGPISKKIAEVMNWSTGLAGMGEGQIKYEKYTRAVQTITNATGKSVAEVSKSLDKLMKYTDETSYDFAEMVASIGKFTSVGLELEKSEEAMEGIANWAAKSGAGKAEANRAMYNISQAMGVGAMKLMDWKSIENANMATKEFKEVAIQTAEAMGTLAKGAVDYRNFNETLKDGWLTSEVLMAVLQQYGDQTTEFGLAAFHAAQEALTFTDAIDALKDAISSGWMRTMELLFGDLDEARKLWTDVANGLVEFSEVFSSFRNDLLEGWHELGGYNAMIEAGTNVWQAFMNVVYGVKDAIANVFPPITAENLVNVTNQMKQASENLLSAFGLDTYTDVVETYEGLVSEAEEFTEAMQKGDKGAPVKQLQKFLAEYGYLDKKQADGVYGKETEKAIKKLQEEVGVKLTGAWDEATYAAVNQNRKFMKFATKERTVTRKNVEEVAKTYKKTTNYVDKLNKNLQRGSKNDQVKLLQQRLIKMGLLSDKAGADGIYGPKTEEAVKKLQKALKVEVTGSWDEATRKAAAASDKFKEVTEVTKMVTVETEGVTKPMQRLMTIVEGIGSVIKIAVGIVKGGLTVVKTALGYFEPLIAVMGRLYSMFGSMFINLADDIERGDMFTMWAKNVVKFLGPVGDVIEMVARSIDRFIDSYAQFLKGNMLRNTFGNFFAYLVETIRQNPVVQTLSDVIGAITEKIRLVYYTIKFNVERIFNSLFNTGNKNKNKKSGPEVVLDGILKAVTIAGQGIVLALAGLAYGLQFAFKYINKYLAPVFKSIGNVITEVSNDMKKGEIKSIPDFFKSLWGAFSKTSVGQFIDGIGKKFAQFFSSAQLYLGQKFPGVVNFFGNAIERLKQLFTFDKSVDIKTNLSNKIQEVKQILKDAVEAIKTEAGKLGDQIKYLFSFNAQGRLNLFDEIADKLKVFQPIVDKFVSIKDRFVEAWKDFIGAGKEGDKAKSDGFVSVFDKVKEFFINLTKIDFGKLITPALIGLAGYTIFNGVKAVKNFSEVLNEGGIAGLLLGNGGDDNKDTLGNTALKLAGSVVAMAAAVGLLSIIDAGKAAAGMGILETIIGTLLGVQIAIKKLDLKKINIGSEILNLSKSLLVMVAALAAMTALVKAKGNTGEFAGALFLIAGFLAGMTAIEVAIAKSASKKTGVSGILEMCEGVLVLVVAMKAMISTIKGQDELTIAASLGMVALLVAELGGIAILMAKFTAKGGKSSMELSIKGMVALCAGVATLVRSFGTILKTIEGAADEKALWGAFGVIEALLVTLGSIPVLIAIFGKSTGISTFGIAAQMVALGFSMKMIVEAFANAIQLIKNVNPDVMKTFFAGVEVGVGLLAGIVFLFSKIPTAELVQGELGLLGLVGVIAAAVAILGEVADNIIRKFANCLFVVGDRLKQFNDLTSGINWTNLETVITFFKEKLPEMITAIIGIKTDEATIKMGQILNIAADLNNYAILLEGVGDALDDSDKAKQLVEKAKEIAETANGLSVPENVEQGKLSILGAALLSYHEMLGEVTDTSNSVIAKQMAEEAEAIATALNNVSVNKGVDEQLVLLGAALKLYYGEIEGIGKVDADGNELEEGFEANLTHIDSQMISEAMAALSEAIPPETVDLISSFGEDGENDAAAMALGIEALGTALKQYGESIGTLNMENVKSANEALEGIKDLDEYLNKPKWEIIVPFLKNKNVTPKSLASFSLDIISLGIALGTYGTFIGTLKADKVRSANRVLTTIASLGKDDSSFFDKVLQVFGYADESNRIEIFRQNLTKMGGAMKSYIDNIDGIDDGKVTTGNKVITAVAGIAEQLGKDGGFFSSWLTGNYEKTLQNIGNNMHFLGEGIGKFVNGMQYIKDVDTGVITNVEFKNIDESVKIVRAIGYLLGNLEKSGAMDWLVGEQSLTKLGGQLEGFATNLVTFQGKAANITPDNINPALDVIERIIGWVGSWESVTFTDESNQLHNKLSEVATGAKQAVKALAELANSSVDNEFNILNILGIGTNDGPNILEAFSTLGKTVVSSITSGIQDTHETNMAKTAIGTVIEEIAVKAEGFYDRFYSAGQYVIEGFIAGLNDKGLMEKLAATGYVVGITPYDSATGTLEVRSPSKKFMWVGQMCALGLKNGLEKYAYLVKDPSMNLANASLKEIMSAYDTSKIADVGVGALSAIKSMLIDKSGNYGEKESNFIKEMLVAMGYLKDASAETADVIEAIKKVKSEILGYEGNLDGSWNRKTSIDLYNKMVETFEGKLGEKKYTMKQYKSEMSNLKTGNKNLNWKQSNNGELTLYSKQAKNNKEMLAVTKADSKNNKKQSKTGELILDVNKKESKIVKNTAAKFDKVLKKGVQGEDVKKLQSYLNTLASTTEKLAVDGIFGTKTENAVKAAQKANGIKATGEYDTNTADAINKKAEAEAKKKAEEEERQKRLQIEQEKKRKEQEAEAEKREKNRRRTLEMQKNLVEHGYLLEGSFEWGKVDNATKAAIELLRNDVINKGNGDTVEKILKGSQQQSKLDYRGSALDIYDNLISKIESEYGEGSGIGEMLTKLIGKNAHGDEYVPTVRESVRAEDTLSDNILNLQYILEKYGYLKTDGYTPGVMSKDTYHAMVEFALKALKYSHGEEITVSQILGDIEALLLTPGALDSIVEAGSSKKTKKTKEQNEEKTKLRTVYGDKYNNNKGKITSIQQLMADAGYISQDEVSGRWNKNTKNQFKRFRKEVFGYSKVPSSANELFSKSELDELYKWAIMYNGDIFQVVQMLLGNTDEWMNSSVFSKNTKTTGKTTGTTGKNSGTSAIEQSVLDSIGDVNIDSLKDGALDSLNGIVEQLSGDEGLTSGLQDVANNLRGTFTNAMVGEDGTIMESAMDALLGDKSASEVFLDKIKNLTGLVEGSTDVGVTGGEQLGNGYVTGMENSTDAIYDAGVEAGDAANDGFEDATEVNSPSRLWMWFGQMMVAGLVNGLKSGSTSINTAVSNLATGAYRAASDAINALKQSIVNGSANSSTLRPVLDSSNLIKGGLANVNANNQNGTNNPLSRIRTSSEKANVISSNIERHTRELKLATAADDRSIIQEFRNVNNRIASLGSDIRNLKLYLDGDKLVGGIESRMDAALGKRQQYSRRGM